MCEKCFVCHGSTFSSVATTTSLVTSWAKPAPCWATGDQARCEPHGLQIYNFNSLSTVLLGLIGPDRPSNRCALLERCHLQFSGDCNLWTSLSSKQHSLNPFVGPWHATHRRLLGVFQSFFLSNRAVWTDLCSRLDLSGPLGPENQVFTRPCHLPREPARGHRCHQTLCI